MLNVFQKINKSKKVFIGLSGGVDSSVAAFLLKKAGYLVTGVHIRGYNIDGCAEDDATMARRVANHLDIPFYTWDMEEEYKKSVVDYMIASYSIGITPNPDVMCNKEIKFGLFFKKAKSLLADYIATGHYALLNNKKNILCIPKDKSKDQTYFLWTLNQDIIENTLFPLGKLLKSEVRTIANKIKLPNALKKDSQGICFLGKLKMIDFLSLYIKEDKGEIIDHNSKIIGYHRGLNFYTLGQRHLGIKGMGGGEVLYIAKKDREKNTLIVTPKNHPLVFTKEVLLKDINYLGDTKIKKIDILTRLRYRSPLVSATLIFTSKNRGNLIFKHPFAFATPGQSAVFYSKHGEMLGGGIVV